MYAKVCSCSLNGLDSRLSVVESDLSKGLPGFSIVGLPDASVKESKERIRSAIINSSYKFPNKKITVNLAPASTKKEGTHFDLPIAIGIMRACEIIEKDIPEDVAFIGELALDGKLTRIKGALPLTIGLRDSHVKKIFLPIDNIEEASLVKDIELFPVKCVSDIVEYFNDSRIIEPHICTGETYINEEKKFKNDFCDVAGQESVKRAMQIAAAGGHNIMMIGPPGAGKTMVARRMPGILPQMTYEEQLEITKIYSVAGELNEDMRLVKERPFRSPHHTISSIAMVGGGKIPKPGEISLSHFGVLFLDELPEFNRSVLEILRQPLEDGEVSISRVNGSYTYPSKFILVASMNPCPCGYYGDATNECTCTPSQINKYISKISGPLLDRIDMHIEVFPISFDEISGARKHKSTEEMRAEVELARQIQVSRYVKEGIFTNSQLSPSQVKKYCKLDDGSQNILELAFKKLSLSARAYNRIIKMSRTIADLDKSETILSKHVAEALQYRNLDKKYKGV